MVSFNINVNFTNSPLGADTDQIQDVVCYLKLIEAVTMHCQKRNFNLIEYLARSVHQKISDTLALYIFQVQSITVILHKISPPVQGIHGGVKWTHYVNYGGAL